MKNTLVVHLTSVNGSMQASARVASFLADTLKVPLVDDADSLLRVLSGFNVSRLAGRTLTVIFVNGPIAFCDYRDDLGNDLLPYVERVVWVQQDYTITMPPNQAYSRPTKAETPFRREFASIPQVYLWSTCQDVLARRQEKLFAGCEFDEYVDWNALTYAPMPADPKTDACFREVYYYGALRNGRAQALARFFGGMQPGHATISVSNPRQNVLDEWHAITLGNATLVRPHKNTHKPYKPSNGNAYGQSSIIPATARYAHSLYVGDDESNRHFHSLANRFYEVLSTPSTVLWLDSAGEATYRAAGLRGYEEFCVPNGRALQDRVLLTPAKRARLAAKQRELWLITDPYKALVAKVRQLGKQLEN